MDIRYENEPAFTKEVQRLARSQPGLAARLRALLDDVRHADDWSALHGRQGRYDLKKLRGGSGIYSMRINRSYRLWVQPGAHGGQLLIVGVRTHDDY